MQEEDPNNIAPDLPPNFGYYEFSFTIEIFEILLTLYFNRSQKYLASFPENEIVLNKINQLTNNFCSTYILVKGSEAHITERVCKIVEKATEVRMKILLYYYSDS